MTTTAALTLSNGYALFGDPNFLATPDHAHDWYDFWNVDLGTPLEPPRTDRDRIDGGFVRRFTHGEAVFNPPYNVRAMTPTFVRPMLRVSTGEVAAAFRILVGDGDIFLVPQAPAAD